MQYEKNKKGNAYGNRKRTKKEYGQHTFVSGTSARRVGLDFFV